jgi:hypothetical protein
MLNSKAHFAGGKGRRPLGDTQRRNNALKPTVNILNNSKHEVSGLIFLIDPSTDLENADALAKTRPPVGQR